MQRIFPKVAGLLIVLAASQVLPFAASARAEENAAPEVKKSLPSITVIQPLRRKLVDRLAASGTIRPVEEIFIQPQVEGLAVEKLEADTGDKVEAGAVLAVLASDSLILQKSQLEASKARAEASLAQVKAQVLEAQASYDDAVRQRDRATTLGRSGTVTTAQVEQLTAQAKTAEARLQAAKQSVVAAEAEIRVADSQLETTALNLARTSIRTPVAGIISARNARIGAIASGSGEPLFRLIRDGDIELVADVPETELLKIRLGQKATMSISGDGEALSGVVRLVSPVVDQTTRLGQVHIAIDDDNRARSGMYASAVIIAGEAEGLALPLSAITTSREGSIVRKVEGGVVKQVTVTTGIQDGPVVQILSGLGAEDRVVERAGAFVRDGDHINPVDSQAQTAAPGVSN